MTNVGRTARKGIKDLKYPPPMEKQREGDFGLPLILNHIDLPAMPARRMASRDEQAYRSQNA